MIAFARWRKQAGSWSKSTYLRSTRRLLPSLSPWSKSWVWTRTRWGGWPASYRLRPQIKLPPQLKTRLSPSGERERRRHLAGPSHRDVRLQSAGDLTARAAEDWRSKRRGVPLHRGRDGHRHVRGEVLRFQIVKQRRGKRRSTPSLTVGPRTNVARHLHCALKRSGLYSCAFNYSPSGVEFSR